MKKFLVGLLFLVLVPFSAYATQVDLELALLVDVSGSVSNAEYILQRDGYKNAFLDTYVQSAILSGTYNSIAVTYIEWDNSVYQRIGWTLLDSAASISAFANSIGSLSRAGSGSTAPGTAINYAYPLFATNTYDGEKQVIDVSGDGSQNTGLSTSGARDAALLAGIDAINGLAILGSETGLEAWYNSNIKGGTGAFVIAANDFAAFESAIKAKLYREITGGEVPEPATMVLFGLGLLGLAGVSRKK